MSIKEELLARYERDLVVPDMSDIPAGEKPMIRDFLNIKRHRMKKSIEKIAAESGVPKDTVYRALKPDGATSCNIHTMGPIAKSLNFSLDDYYAIVPEKRGVMSHHEHEMELLTLKLEHEKEKLALSRRDSQTKSYIMAGLFIVLLFAFVDLIMPDIGLTSGSPALALVLVLVIFVYTACVLYLIRRSVNQ